MISETCCSRWGCGKIFSREFGFQYLCRPCWAETIGSEKVPGCYNYLRSGGWLPEKDLVGGRGSVFNVSDMLMMSKTLKVTHPDMSDHPDAISVTLWIRGKWNDLKRLKIRSAKRLRQERHISETAEKRTSEVFETQEVDDEWDEEAGQ